MNMNDKFYRSYLNIIKEDDEDSDKGFRSRYIIKDPFLKKVKMDIISIKSKKKIGTMLADFYVNDVEPNNERRKFDLYENSYIEIGYYYKNILIKAASSDPNDIKDLDYFNEVLKEYNWIYHYNFWMTNVEFEEIQDGEKFSSFMKTYPKKYGDIDDLCYLYIFEISSDNNIGWNESYIKFLDDLNTVIKEKYPNSIEKDYYDKDKLKKLVDDAEAAYWRFENARMALDGFLTDHPAANKSESLKSLSWL